jgi:hypothetical protein
MIWREKRVLLGVLAVLLAANAIYFFTYRVRYQARLDGVEQDLEQKEQQLEQAHLARLRAEKRYQSYRQIERDVQRVFDEYWSTQPERLTKMIGEVKRLAVASSLVPPSYAFDQDDAKQLDPNRRRRDIGAKEVGVAFAVNGTYEQVRRLINLLELSQQFVIIDQIALAAAEGETLAVNLHLKTLFRDEKTGVASKRL